MFLKKEQDKIPEQLSEVEIGNLPRKEFRVMMIQDLKIKEAQIKNKFTRNV